MINWKSILSAFDDKPTLLQWLKLVEKALQESVLETVTVNDTGNSAISFTFTFADGTSLTTPTTHIDTALYKHALNISVSIDGSVSTISINGYFNYDKEFTIDTLKQYLNGKGRLFIYNNVGSTGVVYNGIAYNRNTQNVEIVGYSLSSNNAFKATITAVNVDNPVKL